MNVPNILTTMRIFLTGFFLYFIHLEGTDAKIVAGCIFILATITDYFDGVLARRYNLITNYGKIMDPIADKFLVLSAFISFAVLSVIPWWMVVIIAFREISVTLIRLIAIAKGKVLAAENMGKIKTTFQMIAILVIIHFLIKHAPAQADVASDEPLVTALYITGLMLMTVFITLISGISFLNNNREFFKCQTS